MKKFYLPDFQANQWKLPLIHETLLSNDADQPTIYIYWW